MQREQNVHHVRISKQRPWLSRAVFSINPACWTMTRSRMGIVSRVILIVQIRKYICHNRVSTQLRRLPPPPGYWGGFPFAGCKPDGGAICTSASPTVSRVYRRETVGGCPRGSPDAIVACLVGFWG